MVLYNPAMVVGERIRAIREEKNLSQGDIEKRSGLLRHYVSRVENGHTIPSVETLEKFARALGVPLYELFYEGEEPPGLLRIPKRATPARAAFDRSQRERRFLLSFSRLLARIKKRDRLLLLAVALKMARQ
jgi:transcriptional regulator with XRE-family HTH domain